MPIILDMPQYNDPLDTRCVYCNKVIDGLRPGLRLMGNVYVIQMGVREYAGLIGEDGNEHTVTDVHASCLIDTLLEVIQTEIQRTRDIRKTVKENMEED